MPERALTQDECDVLDLPPHGNRFGELWTAADLTLDQLARLIDAYYVGTLIAGGIAS